MILYKAIEKNKRNSIYIVGGFIFFVLFVGSIVTYINFGDFLSGLIIAGGFSIIYAIITIKGSTKMIMKMNKAREIVNEDEHIFLWHTVDNLSMVARIPRPRIFIINDSSPNAFATGVKPEKASVAVTTGLLDLLNREEIEGVIAHEIAHIKNYDVRLQTIAVALVGVIAILADIGLRMLVGGRDRKPHPIVLFIGIVFILLSPIIAMVIQLTLSRNREYLADAVGAELCRNPEALASALEKIESHAEPVKTASKSTATLYISDPFKRKKEKANWFSTHPPISERIYYLRNM